MKTKLLYLTLLISSQLIYAQCVQNASQFGNNNAHPTYNITGDVAVTLNSNGQSVSLNTGSNFSTAQGPDVKAYFVKSAGKTNAQIAATSFSNLEKIYFGLISSNSVNANGAKSFNVNIPNNANIGDYDTVFFYCGAANLFWDLGRITPFSSNNCGVLNTNNLEFEKQVAIYPNPVENNLNINTNESETGSFKIYTLSGNTIAKGEVTGLTTINLNNLKSGLYLVEINSGDKKVTKKIIKQ